MRLAQIRSQCLTFWPAVLRAGSAAAIAEAMKSQTYADVTTDVDFFPIAIETSGTWGEHAGLSPRYGDRPPTGNCDPHEPRSTEFLRQRLSVAVQRGNVFWITGTFRRSYSAVTEI